MSKKTRNQRSACKEAQSTQHQHREGYSLRHASQHIGGEARSPWGFYPMFVLTVAGILVLSAALGGALLWLMYNAGLLEGERHNPLPILILVGLPSLSIGLLLVSVFGRAAVRPITKLSEGLNQVASGNFSVRLDKDDRGQFGIVNQNFNQMAEELESIEMLREDFIVNVSHEFKSPLSSIQGYATLLQDATLSESERAEYLEAIFSATRSLSNMSSNILELSNLNTHMADLPREEFSLDEQIRQAIVMLEPIISEKGIALDIELENTDIAANPELLETVWINVLGNAIKFTEPSGSIAVRLKILDGKAGQGTQVEAVFTDTGCGMNEEELAHIFDKFYQADSSHKAEGNGLGLALASTIVQKHGGTIDVTSTLGEGSTFRVRLPLG